MGLSRPVMELLYLDLYFYKGSVFNSNGNINRSWLLMILLMHNMMSYFKRERFKAKYVGEL
jgi:hypothetical protein